VQVFNLHMKYHRRWVPQVKDLRPLRNLQPPCPKWVQVFNLHMKYRRR